MKHIHTPVPALRQRRNSGGFTLVEMMIAMTVGLVLALAVAFSMLSMGHQFRLVGAGSAAQINAQLAVSVMNEAGRQAGAGMYSNGQPICQGFNAWRNGVVVSNGATLMPARITDGGANTAPDSLLFNGANAIGSLSGLPVLEAMATGTASVVVSDGGLIAANDLAIVGVPGSTTEPCTLFQVSGAPAVGAVCGGNATQCKTLARAQAPGAGYNAPAGTFASEPRYGFSPAAPVVGPAVVMRLGPEFRQEAFAVMCNTLVQFNAFSDVPTCSSSPLSFGGGANALATDIVQQQAQYGISATAASDVVTNWVAASGVWANPSASDAQRIKAVRVVVVARSKEPDGALVSVACTNNNGVVNIGPCSFDDAEAPVIDLSATSVPAGRNWRNFRYRVHQAVIPLRNVIWSN